MPQSCIYEGEVMHCRLRPRRHRFVYRVFSLLLDLDALDGLGRRLRLFSYNRFNLFAFHDRDHGDRDGSRLRPWVERRLAEDGIDLGGGRIFIHALPRLLGYVFNPLSVYWCYAADGTLRAILYEVKNTFGEQHSYVLPVARGHVGGSAVRQRCAKGFFVSPFIGMEAEYRFNIREPEERLSILIRETVPEGDLLIATHIAQRRRLSDRGLGRAFLLFPMVTLKVIAAIHWEALKLWVKGVALQKRPPGRGEVDRERKPGSSSLREGDAVRFAAFSAASVLHPAAPAPGPADTGSAGRTPVPL